MVRGRPLVPDRRTALLGGFACVFVGTLLLFDAFERRGKTRPFALRFIPGL